MLRSGCNGLVLIYTTTSIGVVIIDVVKLRERDLSDMVDQTDWRTLMSWEWRQGHGCP
jgi:hypothetical protein